MRTVRPVPHRPTATVAAGRSSTQGGLRMSRRVLGGSEGPVVRYLDAAYAASRYLAALTKEAENGTSRPPIGEEDRSQLGRGFRCAVALARRVQHADAGDDGARRVRRYGRRAAAFGALPEVRHQDDLVHARPHDRHLYRRL